jgi:uncharacterized membrane protein
MAQARSRILHWAQLGRIAPGQVRRALEAAGALPDAARWRRFLDRVLLFMGGTLLAASVVFFFAYNWQDLGRLAKFALAEAPIVLALALLWRLGLERISGEAALFVAALLVGALLALVGQVYQTGADTFELFAAWALAILPWVLVGRSAALWLVWLAIVNLACVFYFRAVPGLLGFVLSPERQLWALFAIDTAALAAWEFAADRGVAWLRARWAPRLVATASGGFATALALLAIFDRDASAWNVPAWLAWLGAAYFAYRVRARDLYVLAGGALSVIVVTAALLGHKLPMREAGELLLVGLVVIGLSALAAYWLRRLAGERVA